MNRSHVEQIADAVLYEGYLLYPYRLSTMKNQQRWNFGVLTPKSYSETQGGTENWTMQTECLIESNAAATINLKVRFLQLVTRDVQRVSDDGSLPTAGCEYGEIKSPVSSFHRSTVPSVNVNGQLLQTRQEAIERDVQLPDVALADPGAHSCRKPFSFPQVKIVEPLIDDVSGETVAVIVRSQQAIEGAIEVQIEDLEIPFRETEDAAANELDRRSLRKFTVRILNLTPFEDAAQQGRDQALMRSFVSTHTILRLRQGEFVSLLDPPALFREAAGNCNNVGTYPVLAGEEGRRDFMLSSPIILYDYPQIAPESAGELFDGTEIDEILTLRIMTLTEAEKEEIRQGDERARRILGRTETMGPEQFMKLHGVLRRPRAFGDEPV